MCMIVRLCGTAVNMRDCMKLVCDCVRLYETETPVCDSETGVKLRLTEPGCVTV